MYNTKFVAGFLLIILGLIWGSSFILMKIGLHALAPIQIASLRIGIAGFSLLPFIIPYVNRVEKKDRIWIFLTGLVGNGIPSFLFAYAQTSVSSSTTGALNSLTPIFALLTGLAIFRMSLDKYKMLGVMIGFIGSFVLITWKANGELQFSPMALWIVLATFMYGLNVNILKLKLSKYPPLMIASLPLGTLFLPAVLIFFSFPLPNLNSQEVLQSVFAIGLLGIIGTAFALILFNRLIQISSAVFASSVTYLIPFVALFIGWLDGEQVGWIQLAAVLVIVIGILIIRKGNKQENR
ncbi:MAG: Uncharacterised protein [Bacteroidetes bacterium MED-G17]|nr:MAG: Uncharacterised protein [Bacteroidetes bacterium MED-G17]